MQKPLILFFWLFVWEGLSRLTANSILLVGPVETLTALKSLLPDPAFWQALLQSFLHIGSGFLLALILGILFGFFAYKSRLLAALLSPPVSLMKAIPVASFVILALIWLGGSRRLSTFVSFVVVFPLVFLNTKSGLDSADPKLLECAAVFHLGFRQRLRFLYLPALLPYLLSCLRVAVGLCWKSGIAAELIGQPRGTIGANLYQAKIFLDTSSLFAWTAAAIFLSFLTERILLWAFGLAAKKLGCETGTNAETKTSSDATHFPPASKEL